MPFIPIPPVTVLPSLDRTDPTFREDVDTFFGTQVPTFTTEINAVIAAIEDNNVEIEAAVVSTSSDAAAASTSASNASASENAAEDAKDAVEAYLATMPEGAINDSIVSTTNTWSSDKITDELLNVSATGDVLVTTRVLNSPDWLPCDGRTYLKTSYPDLATTIGTIGLLDSPLPVTGGTYIESTIAYCARFSKDSVYLLLGSNTTWNLSKRSGNTYVNLSSTSFSGQNAVCFGGTNSEYIAICGPITPFINFYKRTGDSVALVTQPTKEAYAHYSVAPDSTGTYWATTMSTSFIELYKRSADTFTKLTNPSTMPAGLGVCCDLNPDGSILVVPSGTSGTFLYWYTRSGDTFTSVTHPLPFLPVNPQLAKFDPTGRYLAVIGYASLTAMSTLVVYDSNNNWSATAIDISFASLPKHDSLYWSPDSSILAVGEGANLTLFDTKSNFSEVKRVHAKYSGGSISGVAISHDNRSMIVTTSSAGKNALYAGRYDPSTLFAVPNLSLGSPAYIKTGVE
jgi:hypothetical protein